MKENKNEKLPLQRIITEFNFSLYSQGKPESTIKAYTTDIKQFLDFINENYQSKYYIDDINIRILQDYVMYLQEKVVHSELSSVTKDRKLDSLSVLYKFLELIFDKPNLFKKLVINRTKKNGYNPETEEFQNKIQFLSKQECSLLLEKIKGSHDIYKTRDYCMVLLMLTTGMRGSSVREACWQDIDLIKKEMFVRNVKSKIVNKIPITDELCQAFADYKNICGINHDQIFLSNKGTPISKTAFNNAIKRILSYINVNKNGTSAHIFRHTFVMIMLNAKEPKEKIIKFTGHSSTDELGPYIHLLTDDLRDCLKHIS